MRPGGALEPETDTSKAGKRHGDPRVGTLGNFWIADPHSQAQSRPGIGCVGGWGKASPSPPLRGPHLTSPGGTGTCTQ